MTGAIRSAVSEVLATLGGAFDPPIPQISSLSTSRSLESAERYPYFARTIPSNLGSSVALCLYLQSIGVQNFGVFF